MLAGVLAALLAGLSLGAAAPKARQVYGLVFTSQVVETLPCLFSIALPPVEKEKCTPWTRRESGGPTFHPPSGIVVVGG